jgi:hypothetical protein
MFPFLETEGSRAIIGVGFLARCPPVIHGALVLSGNTWKTITPMRTEVFPSSSSVGLLVIELQRG